jgi:hypothetical protein
VVFYDLNGLDLDPPTVDGAVDLVIAVATGQVDLPRLTGLLATWAHQR